MGKIKKILENELAGGTQTTDVYPVTSTKAVYDANNKRLDEILSASTEAINGVTNQVTELEQGMEELNISANGGNQKIDIGDGIVGGYYSPGGKLTVHDSAVYYTPIDVSAYRGKQIKISITWQPDATISGWVYLCMFRNNADTTLSADTSGRTKEKDLHDLAINNTYDLEIEVTDNYLLLSKRDVTTTIGVTCLINGKFYDIEEQITGKFDKDLVEEFKSINLFDPTTGDIDGQYVSGCKAYLSGNESKIVLSSTGTQMQSAYIRDLKFYYNNGTYIDAVVSETKYSSSQDRRGCVFDVPSGAAYFSFTYRAEYSGGTLLYEVMVSAGEDVPNVFIPYSHSYQFKNPNYDSLLGDVYVSTSGNDSSGDGSKQNPYATIPRALRDGKSIVVRGGFYEVNTINFEYSPNKNIKIRAEKDERPVLFGGTKILDGDGTLVSGYTKVYSATVSKTFSFDTHWIFQYGVEDAGTNILNNERTPYHGRKDYRCDFTALIKVSSIEDVENTDGYSYYYDGNGTLYYSRPEVVSQSKFLFGAVESGYLFTGTTGVSLKMCGIVTYGKTFNLVGLINSEIVNCCCFASRNGAGFKLDNSVNLLLDRCEACRVENGVSLDTGDGFNVHTNTNTQDNIKYCSFELRNCWSHDNWNDGYSDHEGCEGFINGGLYEHNCIGGSGSGITPSYGAHDIIKDAICQSNKSHGLCYVGDGSQTHYETGEYGSIQVVSVVSRYNNSNGFHLNTEKQIGDFVNCIAYNNNGYGFSCADGQMRCLNSVSSGNVSGQYNGDIIQIKETN